MFLLFRVETIRKPHVYSVQDLLRLDTVFCRSEKEKKNNNNNNNDMFYYT